MKKLLPISLMWIVVMSFYTWIYKVYKPLTDSSVAMRQFEDSAESYTALPINQAMWSNGYLILIVILAIITYLVLRGQSKK